MFAKLNRLIIKSMAFDHRHHHLIKTQLSSYMTEPLASPLCSGYLLDRPAAIATKVAWSTMSIQDRLAQQETLSIQPRVDGLDEATSSHVIPPWAASSSSRRKSSSTRAISFVCFLLSEFNNERGTEKDSGHFLLSVNTNWGHVRRSLPLLTSAVSQGPQ